MAEKERELSDDDRIIDADPSKRFFIWMLTRDIGVADCILDLIDNPVDNIVEDYDIDVSEPLFGKKSKAAPKSAVIDIKFDTEKVEITDTCGGISVEEARKNIFRFGYPDEERSDRHEPGLSVYGVGMKRAFFKLGRMVTMKSATKTERFEVNLDVKKWAQDAEWKMQFASVSDIVKPSKKFVPGTSISIGQLTSTAKRKLADPQFAEELRARIGTTHGLFLKAGLKINVNGRAAADRLPQIISSQKVQPVRKSFKREGMETIIIAGLTPREDRVPRGWYVFCNGRMIVEADKTHLTGWGDRFPIFHSKYNHFCGFVYFRSKNVNALPWTTTKQGVEKESEVFQDALEQMRLVARPITEFLNELYDVDMEDTASAQRNILLNAPTKSVEKLAARDRAFQVPKQKDSDSLLTIQYRRKKSEIDRVRKALGSPKMAVYKVGEETFDYFVEHELE